MRHPGLFRSVSAFAPIAAPMLAPWGQKAFTAYLGPDQSRWAHHDASRLIAAGKASPFDEILVDQGLADNFLAVQLQPEQLESAATAAGLNLRLRRHPGYDHSYYFIQSFIAEHLAFHAQRLGTR
jgi:S-formylglutathione hydrolase